MTPSTFRPKPTRKKKDSVYKTLYLRCSLSKKIELLAKQYDTSFNNIVISILEDFFDREEP